MTVMVPVCLMLLLILLIFHSIALIQLAAAAANFNSSLLQLSPGLNLSISSSFTRSRSDYEGKPYLYPISSDLMFTVGIPTLDEDGIFLPILSSPSFNYTSNVSSQSRGFSLGFYFSSIRECCNSMYMAVCVGSSGNYTLENTFTQIVGNESNLDIDYTLDGFVVPVWIANLDRPIKDPESASLRVDLVNGGSSNNVNLLELRLMDGDDVVWNTGININSSAVGNNNIVMEMQDSGKLVIYDDSVSRSTRIKPVYLWQSPNRTDMLLEGQMLEVGSGDQLTSNDSSYSARMEKGALVLYINTLHFNGLQPPAPYWICPLIRSPNDIEQLMSANDTINQLINSAPCSTSSAYAVINHTESSEIYLDVLSGKSGSCSQENHEYEAQFIHFISGKVSWSFLRMENDGRLYMYAVWNPIGAYASATRFSLATSSFSPGWLGVSSIEASLGECDVPMACGPAGLCTPHAPSPCGCQFADIYIEPINETDLSKGCKRRTPLPPCSISGNEHMNSIDFVQLNSTASIFLFTLYWTFNSTQHASHHVDDCKHSCSSNCSCRGFFYQVDTSACFFIREDISLLSVVDRNYSLYSLFPKEILARNYVTYLKVAAATVHGSEKKAGLIIILPSIVACFALGLGGYLLIRALRRKFVQMRMQAREENELRVILPLLPSRFSYKDLHEATKGFSNLLGEGGFGSVYAGILADGRKVAVKVLQIVIQGAGQSKQFLAEVASVGRTNHHNIVRLVGFCWEVSNRLLVYEYVERGSLDRWLFVGKSAAAPLLDWETRYKVVLGIARGLHYLHEECEQPILHFDIKPQNILLGDEFAAKLADFGMSRLMPRDISAVVTGVRGTPGYIAPEWLCHGTGSKKSDVYSTGMVMLEIVGGRKIFDYSLLNSSEGEETWHFPSWAAKKCEQGLLMEIVDERLHVCGFDLEQARRLIHIAFWCIHHDPAMRPNAPTLVQWLEGTSPIEQPSFSTPIENAVKQPSKPYS